MLFIFIILAVGAVRTGATTLAINELVAAHNAARAEVNLGPVSWVESLEQTATVDVGKCPTTHDTASSLVENLSWGWPTMTTAEAFKNWYDEKAAYIPATTSCIPGKVCGHYRNIIQHDNIGCAMRSCTNMFGQALVDTYACHYASSAAAAAAASTPAPTAAPTVAATTAPSAAMAAPTTGAAAPATMAAPAAPTAMTTGADPSMMAPAQAPMTPEAATPTMMAPAAVPAMMAPAAAPAMMAPAAAPTTMAPAAAPTTMAPAAAPTTMAPAAAPTMMAPAAAPTMMAPAAAPTMMAPADAPTVMTPVAAPMAMVAPYQMGSLNDMNPPVQVMRPRRPINNTLSSQVGFPMPMAAPSTSGMPTQDCTTSRNRTAPVVVGLRSPSQPMTTVPANERQQPLMYRGRSRPGAQARYARRPNLAQPWARPNAMAA